MAETSAKRLRAVYYPDCVPQNMDAFASMCFWFDEVHFITPSDDASGRETYTSYLRNLPSEFTVGVIGDTTSPRGQRQIQRASAFWQFVVSVQPLLGEVVFYNPHLGSGGVRWVGNISGAELARIVKAGIEEGEALLEFARSHPEIEDDVLLRLLPTARHLAQSEEFIAVSDNPDLPAPVVQHIESSAGELATSVALECLEVMLPHPIWSNPDDILEIRMRLADELCGFRNLMFKFSGDLRQLLGEAPTREALKREARFLIESRIEPFVFEIQKRVELEEGKLWRKVFGSVVRWSGMVISAYYDPSNALLMAAIGKAGKDLSSLLGAAHQASVARDLGVSYLLKIRQRLKR